MAFQVSYQSPKMTQLYAWENSLSPPKPEVHARSRLPTANFSYTGVDIVYRFEEDTVSKRYEAWSPNHDSIPSYWGVPPSLRDLEKAAADGRFPLFDGSLGGFDYRFFPQVLDDETVELAFITKSERSRVEFAFLGDLCIPVSSGQFRLTRAGCASLVDRAKDLESKRNFLLKRFNTGSLRQMIHPDWLESPTEDEIILQLGHPLPWETLVVRFAAIQRKLARKRAFSMYHKAILDTTSDSEIRRIRTAGDGFIGCWANGLSQRNLNLLLKCGIPVFFLHKYTPDVDYPSSPGSLGIVPDHRQRKERKGLLCVDERIFVEKNKYDELARLSHCPILTTFSLRLPRRPQIAIFDGPFVCGSWHNGHIRSTSELFTLPPPSPPPTPRPNAYGLAPRTSWDDGEDSDEPPLPRLDGFIIEPTARPRPPPPPIQKAHYNKLWVKFKDNGLHPGSSPSSRTFEYVGSRYRPPYNSDVEIWYDRENCRMYLLLDNELNKIDPIKPDGKDEFGRPWPDFALVPAKYGPPTRWVYATKDHHKPRTLTADDIGFASEAVMVGGCDDNSSMLATSRVARFLTTLL